jgi:DNA-binding transcriptional regulator YiaG
MGKIENVMREEFQRLARKEIRQQVDPLRRENRELKKRIVKLEALAKPISKVIKKTTEAKLEKMSDLRASEDEVKSARITPAWVQNLRMKLNLSQPELASLIGVSASAVRSWEYAASLPRGSRREALVALRKLGRRDVQKLLEAQEAK